MKNNQKKQSGKSGSKEQNKNNQNRSEKTMQNNCCKNENEQKFKSEKRDY